MKERAYEIAINCKYDRYQRGIASTVYKLFDKKTGSGENTSVIEELTQELRMPEIKKFRRRKIYAKIKDNIWAADWSETGSLFSKNRGAKYLLCVINVFTKYI